MEEVELPQSFFIGIGAFISKCLIVFGPVIPYIPQYFENRRTLNPTGLSRYVSFLAILSCCLKIGYWCGKAYDLALFLQNFAMILGTLMLVNQRVNIENRKRVVRFDEHNFVGLWQWTNIMSYVQATAYILAMITSCTILFGWVPATFDILALLIFIIESGVSIPQVIQNSQRKTTNGLNKAMVSLWILWDAFKILYMVTYPSPWPFKLTATFQLFVDSAIYLQIFHYGDHPWPDREIPNIPTIYNNIVS